MFSAKKMQLLFELLIDIFHLKKVEFINFKKVKKVINKI